MGDNLALWNAVEKTPQEHTKVITGKSYKGTSPKPHYLIRKATETFGPCGIGWGFTVEERVETGALIADGFFEQMHVAKVRVWYEWQGKRGEVEHIGGTIFSGRYASGKPFTDEDAPKKSVTDALVKALSMIGFAGDIFMGRYDDSKYLAELKAEAKTESAVGNAPNSAELCASMVGYIKEIRTVVRADQWWDDQSAKGEDGKNAFDRLSELDWKRVQSAFQARYRDLEKAAPVNTLGAG